MAAPTATTSSGLTPLLGFLPKNFSTISCTLGIRVEPPTKYHFVDLADIQTGIFQCLFAGLKATGK